MPVLRGVVGPLRQNPRARALLFRFGQNHALVSLEEISLEVGDLFMTVFERAGDCGRRFGQQCAPISLCAQRHSRVALSLLTKRLRRLINLRPDFAPFILIGGRDLRLICHDPDFAHFYKDPLSGYEFRSSQEALRRRMENWRVKPAREEDSNVEQWGL